jgi:hypothetical protein
MDGMAKTDVREQRSEIRMENLELGGGRVA